MIHPPSSAPLLGEQHDALARQMTRWAGAAILAVFAAVSLVVPVVLLLPGGLQGQLIVYGVLEAVFAVIYWYRYLLLSYQPIKHRPLSHDPVAVWQRTLQHLQLDGADIRQFLSIWFHGASFNSIKRENVKELVAYAFWYRTTAEIAAEGRDAELEAQVAALEDIWGVQLQPGYDPELTCMCHLWEPMKQWYRPLAFYVSMEAAALLCRAALWAAGFQRHVCMGLAYYTRNMPAQQQQQQQRGQQLHAMHHAGSMRGVDRGSQQGGQDTAGPESSSSSSDVPLVLIHGIGMGLVPYISMLFNMAATGRPMLALELPHISQRWVLWVPTVDEVTEVLVSVLNRNNIRDCCLIGHSYGSAVASRLLQQSPHRIRQLCLIDPICFAMFHPNLLRNFLYKRPQKGNWLGDFMMTSAARELHVSATLSRRFFWSEVNLWEEQVPAGTLVVLSGRDALMAAPQVKLWLQEHTQAVVLYNPDLAHAGFLLDISWQQHILQQLLQLLGNCKATKVAALPRSQRSSQQSFVSCRSSSSNKAPESHAPEAPAGAPPQPGAAAAPAAPAAVPRPLRSASSPFSLERASTDRVALGVGDVTAKLQAHSSFSGSIQVPTRGSASRNSSMELSSPLYMRSWSGVLPCMSFASAATDASTVSGVETCGPESPRSYSTFVSASSVQCSRGLAATAAAQEATHAAHVLLQPLLAMQQRKEQKQRTKGQPTADVQQRPGATQDSLRASTTADSAGVQQRTPSSSSCQDDSHTTPSTTGAVECLVCCGSVAAPAAAGQKHEAHAGLQPPDAVLQVATAAGMHISCENCAGDSLSGLRVNSAPAAAKTQHAEAAAQHSTKRPGVLQRVESLLQGRVRRGVNGRRGSM